MARRRKTDRIGKRNKARRERLKTIGIWAALIAGTYEGYLAFVVRRQKQRDLFNAALNRQVATSKPLIVIGDPDGRLLSRALGRDYDCGDMCLDIRGCAKCPNGTVGDPLATLKTLKAGSAVIFVGLGQLERARDPEALMKELSRVSNGDLFVAHYEPFSLAPLLPPSRRWVTTAPSTTPYTEYRDLPWIGFGKKHETKRLGNLYVVHELTGNQ